MKEKILAFLKTRLPGVLESFLAGVADDYGKTITQESDIETTFSDGVINLLKISARELQKEGDRRANDAAAKRENSLKEKFDFVEKKTGSSKVELPDDTPAWAKALIKQNDELAARVASFEKDKTTGGLMERVKTKLSEKKIPEALLKGRTIEKEEDIDTLITEVEADHNSIVQAALNERGITDIPKSPNPADEAKSLESDIQAWAASKQPVKEKS